RSDRGEALGRGLLALLGLLLLHGLGRFLLLLFLLVEALAHFVSPRPIGAGLRRSRPAQYAPAVPQRRDNTRADRPLRPGLHRCAARAGCPSARRGQSPPS